MALKELIYGYFKIYTNFYNSSYFMKYIFFNEFIWANLFSLAKRTASILFVSRSTLINIIIFCQVVNKLMYTCAVDHTARCWVVEFGDCTRIYKGPKHTVGMMQYQDGLCKYNTDFFIWCDLISIFVSTTVSLNCRHCYCACNVM